MKRILLSLTLLSTLLIGCKKDSSVGADPEPEVNMSVAEQNARAATRYLEEARQLDGIQVTGSGLMYQVIEDGEGDKPNAASMVTVHYEGTFPDGEVFDSSVARGTPATFPLSRVIPGWTEGVQLMSPGAKYKFHIPPSLAYGATGTPGGPIGPNQALVFTVELISFE